METAFAKEVPLWYNMTQSGVSKVISNDEYLRDPCRMASIPYWKAVRVPVPENMKILHADDFYPQLLEQYTDEPYFRLRHDLHGLSAPQIPHGFSLCEATPAEFCAHISQCYADIGITAAGLQSYIARPVYDAALWLAVKDDHTGKIVATGIAELDREIGEGILEWIQVSGEYRSRGLGSYIVAELLWRMKDSAQFATVSGQCHNPTNPEAMYRKCGFTGNDIWHILKKR